MKSSNRKTSRRPKQRRAPNSRSSGTRIQGGSSPSVSPNVIFTFDRQIADATVYMDGASSLQIIKSPGFTGEFPFLAGALQPDVFANAAYVAFNWSMPLDSLSNIELIQCFRQFRPTAVRLNFQYIGCQQLSVAPPSDTPPTFPEVLICSDPTLLTAVAPTPIDIEQYGGTRKATLTPFRQLSHTFTPRTDFYAGLGATTYLQNQRDFWYDPLLDNSSALLSFFGCRWILRNLTGGHEGSAGVRITAHVRFDVRIPCSTKPSTSSVPLTRPSGLLSSSAAAAGGPASDDDEVVLVPAKKDPTPVLASTVPPTAVLPSRSRSSKF